MKFSGVIEKTVCENFLPKKVRQRWQINAGAAWQIFQKHGATAIPFIYAYFQHQISSRFRDRQTWSFGPSLTRYLVCLKYNPACQTHALEKLSYWGCDLQATFWDDKLRFTAWSAANLPLIPVKAHAKSVCAYLACLRLDYLGKLSISVPKTCSF